MRIFVSSKCTIYFFLLICLISSCNPYKKKAEEIINIAGKNSLELKKVIDHYKDLGEKEKLEAVYFLIGNMNNKYGRYGEITKNYYPVFKLLQELKSKKTDEDTINKQVTLNWDSIEQRVGPITINNYQPYYDYYVLSADYLIENIDYAFKAWKEKPWAKHLDFKKFCEFILPYRVYDEPLQFYRKKFYEEFKWLDDSVKSNDPVEACLILNRYIAKRFVFCSKLDRCPMLGIDDVYNLKGGICEHRYCLLTALMRSVGIPVGIEYTPQRNDEAGGHSWMVLIDKNSTSRFFNGGEPDVTFPDTLYDPIGRGYTTKVFRNTYANQENELVNNIPPKDIPEFFRGINKIDVTNEYQFPQSSISFDLTIEAPSDIKYVFLCCFGYSYQIVPIDYSKISNSVKFKNVGNNCVYFPAYFKDNMFIIASNPKYISSSGSATELVPDMSKQVSVILTRKYYIQQYLFRMNDYAKWMIDAKLQAADNIQFNNPVTLFTIDSSYYHFAEKEITNTKPYQYYRYISSDTGTIRIAEVDFMANPLEYGINKSKIFKVFGYASKDTINHFPAIFENAFDGNIATNFNARPGAWVAIDYGIPVKVSKVRFLVRNDLNVIDVGNKYELFYFDMGWQSLGGQIAIKNYLIYNNIPANALLLLRNLTKGKEERIFIYKDGKQMWL
jgi:hypothetical protein